MTQSLAKQFMDQMNEWHTYPEPFDTKLDIWLHKSYAEIMSKKKNIDWSKLYFSPSAATKDVAELYAKAKKWPKDEQRWKPHQRRYMSQGTVLGDWLQREILLCERHYKKLTGKDPKFKMGLVDGYPAFEDFVFKSHPVEYGGYKFNLNGTTDGILVTDSGEKVLLEVKSKQATPARTSLFSMKTPEEKHVKQVVCYGEMYGISKAIIVYINGAKEGWFADDEKLRKTPDMRAFDVTITEEMREEVFDHFATVAKVLESGDPILPDLTSWVFNDYKQSIADSLSDDDVRNLETAYETQVMLLPAREADSVRSALEDIKRRRN